MVLLDESQFKLLLKQLDIPFQDYPLPQQRLLQQLQEKYLLVFVTSPEYYSYTEAIDHPIHTGNATPIREWYRHIPPALVQEV